MLNSFKNLFFTVIIFCILADVELNSATKTNAEKLKEPESDIIEKMKRYLNSTYPSTKSGLMNILEDWKTEILQKIRDSDQNQPKIDKKKLDIEKLKIKFNQENIENLINQMKNSLEKNCSKSILMSILKDFCTDLPLSSSSVLSEEKDKIDHGAESNALLEELGKAIKKESKYLTENLTENLTLSKLIYLLDNFKLKILQVIKNFGKDTYIYDSVKQELVEYLNSSSNSFSEELNKDKLNKFDSFKKELNKIFDNADRDAQEYINKLNIQINDFKNILKNPKNPKNPSLFSYRSQIQTNENMINNIKKLGGHLRERDLQKALKIDYIVRTKRELSYFFSELNKELNKDKFETVDQSIIYRYFGYIFNKILSIKKNLDSDTYIEEKNIYIYFSLTKDNFQEFKEKFNLLFILAEKKINELNENFNRTNFDELISQIEQLRGLVNPHDMKKAPESGNHKAAKKIKILYK